MNEVYRNALAHQKYCTLNFIEHPNYLQYNILYSILLTLSYLPYPHRTSLFHYQSLTPPFLTNQAQFHRSIRHRYSKNTTTSNIQCQFEVCWSFGDELERIDQIQFDVMWHESFPPLYSSYVSGRLQYLYGTFPISGVSFVLSQKCEIYSSLLILYMHTRDIASKDINYHNYEWARFIILGHLGSYCIAPNFCGINLRCEPYKSFTFVYKLFKIMKILDHKIWTPTVSF